MKVCAVSVRRGLIALLLAGLVAPFAPGCGDDPPGANEAPATEPSLTLLSVTGAGARGWHRGDDTACVEFGHDPLQTLIAQVRIDGDWLVRPLHNCESRTRCGYVEITVSNEQGDVLLTEAAASLSINLPFAGITVPTGSSLTFTARLMDQNGEPYIVADGGLCGRDDTCSATLSLTPDCVGSTPDPDASVVDAALTPDATTTPADAGPAGVDAGTPDASAPDAASADSGDVDGGNPAFPDGGPSDGGTDASDAADAG
ncbi:MAG TPA: hypothetical protein VHO25_21495 [Polyangiaceae bacterium]|nr:hypothetical protein [Polyangiaceae bacterium]